MDGNKDQDQTEGEKMSIKKRVLIGVVIAAVAAVVIFVAFGLGSKPYNYDMSDYVKLAKKDYIGVEIDKVEAAEVTDKDVQSQIDSALESATTTKDKKEGEAKKGNVVVIDYKGTLNGKEFDGGTGKDMEVELGSGSMIDGFEDGIIGMEVGDTKTLDLTFPKSYPANPDLAGKDVKFKVKLKSIKIKSTPDLEDYVKENTDFDSVKEYKASVKKDLEKQNKLQAESTAKNTLWSQIVSKAKIKKYPEKELKAAKEQLKGQLKSYAEQQGTDEKTIRAQLGLSKKKDYNEYIKSQAESSMNNDMVVHYIAQKEDIEADSDDVKDMISQIENAGYTDETFLQQYGMEIEPYAESMALGQAVIDYVFDKAKQVDKKDKKDKKDSDD